MPKVRITVVKRGFHKDLVDRYADTAKTPTLCGACEQFEEGFAYVVDGFPAKPADFPCDWAWGDVHPDVSMIALHSRTPWMAKPGTHIVCSSDGFRPVSFLLERIED
jgi:uncharacterized repeat protein (TIGR04076 family)